MKLGYVLISLFFSTPASAGLSSDTYLQKFLLLSEQNSEKAMALIPPKYDSQGNFKFKNRFVPLEIKDRNRRFICPTANPGERCQPPQFYPTAEISRDNEIRNFFLTEEILSNLELLSENSLQRKVANTKPWSGDYWATYRGGIAARYVDRQFPTSEDFGEILKYFQKNWKIDLGNQAEINKLSPAEKYDLLLGMPERPLTQAILADAYDTYISNNKKIEPWFGICHGWAPVSFMMPRPAKAVEVESVLPGVKILFYPDDIKGLASHLWANATLPNRMLGGRCDDKDPQMDENGRIISDKCYDINPGAWHLTVLNQIGRLGQTFVIDATYDYEVWNQPVVSYSLKFFNPQTHALAKDVGSALIKLSDYKTDRFQKYRSPKAAFVVGVSMVITYITEGEATAKIADGEADDIHSSVQYIYDLEVSAEGEIIGGEWYQNAHPDFLWAPSPKARAVSVADRELVGEWTTASPPPKTWTPKAQFAAGYSQPLAKVIENLIQLAK